MKKIFFRKIVEVVAFFLETNYNYRSKFTILTFQ